MTDLSKRTQAARVRAREAVLGCHCGDPHDDCAPYLDRLVTLERADVVAEACYDRHVSRCTKCLKALEAACAAIEQYDDDDLSVFDDGPAVGLGPDGLTHDDPYCAAIAPLGSIEARRGELCGTCEARKQSESEESA